MKTNKQENATPKSLRPRQVAELLGIGLSTVWVWAKRPDFPRARKIGPQVTVFDRDELVAWRDAQGQR